MLHGQREAIQNNERLWNQMDPTYEPWKAPHQNPYATLPATIALPLLPCVECADNWFSMFENVK